MKRAVPLLLLAATLAAAALLAVGSPEPGPRVAELSLVALGDTGRPNAGPFHELRGQYKVARAIEAEDARAAIDGIVLLGDNFYPDGLEEKRLKDRLRENVVGPYCRFLGFTSRGRGAFEDDCALGGPRRPPIPFYVVLGNHDYKTQGSERLQKEVVPTYLSSWRMPDSIGLEELPGGVSLIPYHSMPMVEGRKAAGLIKALRRSKGPWRILAAHHPIADPGKGYSKGYARRVREAIAASGVPVHLFLAGHEHNLQLIAGEGPDDAALHVIVGGGSDTRSVRPTDRRRLYAEKALGFARIDAHGRGEAARLEVTLFRVSARPGVAATVAARYEVRPDRSVAALR